LRLRREARFLPQAQRRADTNEGKMTDKNEISASEHPQVTNLSDVDVETVQAELVRMNESFVQTIQSDDVELSKSIGVKVAATNVTVHQSAVGVVQAQEVAMQSGGVVAARAETMSINGLAGVAVGESVEFGNAYAGVVAAREVRGERIESLILLSPKVEGSVVTVIDTRGALIAGLVGGLFAGIMLLLGRMLFGKK
jgi:hypothetical protein